MKKRILCLMLTLCLVLPCLAGCGSDGGKAQMLSFSQAQSIKEMQKLNGKKVTIIGYMSTLSPVSGKFMYLMNLPYQSCPFCVPNTTQLSNTMAVYAKSSKGFEFTDRAIRVTGIMDFGDYTDEFGYEYTYRIKDAVYEILDASDLSPELQLWQQLAATDVIGDVYAMFEYVNFLCYWPTYTVQFESGKDYLYPSDALQFVEKEGYQFNYGCQEGYFEGMIAQIQEVDETAFADLVKVIEDAQSLSQRAYQELKDGNCEAVVEYSGVFKDGRKQYKINAAEQLEAGMDDVYTRFSNWLSGWEL